MKARWTGTSNPVPRSLNDAKRPVELQFLSRCLAKREGCFVIARSQIIGPTNVVSTCAFRPTGCFEHPQMIDDLQRFDIFPVDFQLGSIGHTFQVEIVTGLQGPVAQQLHTDVSMRKVGIIVLHMHSITWSRKHPLKVGGNRCASGPRRCRRARGGRWGRCRIQLHDAKPPTVFQFLAGGLVENKGRFVDTKGQIHSSTDVVRPGAPPPSQRLKNLEVIMSLRSQRFHLTSTRQSCKIQVKLSQTLHSSVFNVVTRGFAAEDLSRDPRTHIRHRGFCVWETSGS